MGVTEKGSDGVPPGLGRVADLVGAALLLALAAPLLAVAAAVVWATEGRPIFFGHGRVGRHGRPFRCWKLRTMEVGAEAALARAPELRDRHRANGFKLPVGADPRVTRVGRLLRRSYLDELPQLVNVLRGEMSLVGPRPVVPEELALFEPETDLLLSVRPGLFGAWTSMGRDRPPYPERVRVELDYLRRRSAGGDLAILARSVRAVLQGQTES